jgi:hypothetical protein
VKKRSLSLLIGLAAVAMAILVSAGSAASTTKSYTANICAGGSGPCAAPSAPLTLAGGTSTSVDLTIANNAGTQSLGSVNVTPPAGFGIGTVSPFPTGSSVQSGVIKLRNLNIAAGTVRTFTIAISVPCQSTNPAWTILAKQSNDFNGPPGNAFTLDVPNSSLSTAVTGTCKLFFVNQPKNAQVNTTITSAADDPSGDPVTVEVRDGNNQPITTATGTITLTPSSNALSFTGNSIGLSNGVATFETLKSSATGSYTLIASGDGFTSSDPSDSFTISDFGTVCPAGDTTCTGSASSGDKKTKAAVTSSTSDGFDDATTLEISMLAATTEHCEDFTTAPNSSGVSVDVRPLTDLTEVTITLDKTIVNAFPDNGVAHFNVCFGGKIFGEDPPVTKFPTKPGTAEAQLVDGLFWGILPDCPATPTTPCVASRNKTGSGQAVIVFKVPNPWDLKGYTG